MVDGDFIFKNVHFKISIAVLYCTRCDSPTKVNIDILFCYKHTFVFFFSRVYTNANIAIKNKCV